MRSAQLSNLTAVAPCGRHRCASRPRSVDRRWLAYVAEWPPQPYPIGVRGCRCVSLTRSTMRIVILSA
jgi:hypothetical protein